MSQYSKTHEKQIRKLASKPNKESINSILKIVNADDPSERSLLVRYSVARKILQSFTKNKKLLDMMLPPRDLSNKVNKENTIRRDKKKRILIDERFVRKIMGYRNSENVFELCIFLLLITGRRTGEILNARFYNKRAGRDMYIDGVLKRSSKEAANGCHFPPLIRKTKALRLIKKFRKKLADRGKMNEKSFRRDLLRKTKKLLGANVYPHLLRGIYANYLYKFRNDENMKINSFIMEKLCHEGVTTSLNYTGFELLFDKDFVK